MVHGTDRPYLLSVLAAAKRYGINRLEIAGDNPTFSEEYVQKPRQSALIEEIAQRGRRQGLGVYVWVREFNVPEKAIAADLATAAGAAFWKGRQDALRAALRLMPDLEGVVMSYGSTPAEIWDVRGDAFWEGLSQPQRIRITTERFRDVVVGEFHKRMVVRDFNHSPDQLRWLVEGLRDETGLTMHSKAEPQDWQLYYPHSFAQGAYGRTPQLVEFDLTGEYWGQSLIPVSLVDYLEYRWRYDRAKGAIGMVGRIDRDENRTLGSPDEINVYAHSVLMRRPETPAQAIYEGWNRTRYGLRGDASRRLTEVYRRCTRAAKFQYYTLGFWTPKNQSLVPSKMAEITSAIRSKSAAQWDPAAKSVEAALLSPTPETVAHVLRDKAEAVRLVEASLAELATLKGAMRPADYASFAAQLVFMRDQAQVWEAMARAYWTTRLVQEGTTASEEASRAIDGFAARLETMRNPNAPAWVAAQKAAGRKLTASMRDALESK